MEIEFLSGLSHTNCATASEIDSFVHQSDVFLIQVQIMDPEKGRNPVTIFMKKRD